MRDFADHVDLSARSVVGQVGLARRISPTQARKAITFATGLAQMPHTFDLLRSGRLSEHRASILVDESRILNVEDRARLDATLCADPAITAGWGDRTLRREATALVCQLDQQAALNRHTLAVTERRVGMRSAADGMVWLTALLKLSDGVAIAKTLDACASEAKAAGDPRSRDQIKADTFAARLLEPTSDSGWDPTMWDSPPPQLGPPPAAFPDQTAPDHDRPHAAVRWRGGLGGPYPRTSDTGVDYAAVGSVAAQRAS